MAGRAITPNKNVGISFFWSILSKYVQSMLRNNWIQYTIVSHVSCTDVCCLHSLAIPLREIIIYTAKNTISWHRKNRAWRLVTSWDSVQKGTMLGLGVHSVSLSASVVDRNTHTFVLSARICHAHRFCLFSTVWLLIQIWWYGYSSGLTGGFAHVAEFY